MSGNNRIVNAAMAKPKTPKGSALKSALKTSTITAKIAAVKGNEKQKGR